MAAELIGTFVLVLFGCGSIVFATEAAEGGGFVTTATTVGLTFGLTLMVMMYAFSRVSGAHFNPAVSVGAAMGGRLAWHQVPVYVAAQLVGAILGAAVLFGLLHGFEGFDAEGNMGQNAFGSESPANYALWAALLLELVLSVVFVWVVLAVTDPRYVLDPALAPLAIGFTLVAIHFVSLPATGTSVNPARAIGPALFAGGDSIAQVWLFALGPLLGGAIAGLTYGALFGQATTASPGRGCASGGRQLCPTQCLPRPPPPGASTSGRLSRSQRGRPSRQRRRRPPSSRGLRSRSRPGRRNKPPSRGHSRRHSSRSRAGPRLPVTTTAGTQNAPRSGRRADHPSVNETSSTCSAPPLTVSA